MPAWVTKAVVNNVVRKAALDKSEVKLRDFANMTELEFGRTSTDNPG